MSRVNVVLYFGATFVPRLATFLLLLVLTRLVLALYLLASALARFDFARLAWWEVALRLGLAALVMSKPISIWGPAAAASLIWLVLHGMRHRSEAAPARPAG